jgi:hypothetical protein
MVLRKVVRLFVKFLDLRPLGFPEFVEAVDGKPLADLLAGGDWTLIRSPEGARSEIDFVLQYWGKVIPLEVKAAENLQAKSLKVYHQKYNPARAIRTSMSDYRKEEWMTNLPLYAISSLFSET